jgi:hypothetical protein
MARRRFTVMLRGRKGPAATAIVPPFDVVEVYQQTGRVPVKSNEVALADLTHPSLRDSDAYSSSSRYSLGTSSSGTSWVWTSASS